MYRRETLHADENEIIPSTTSLDVVDPNLSCSFHFQSSLQCPRTVPSVTHHIINPVVARRSTYRLSQEMESRKQFGSIPTDGTVAPQDPPRRAIFIPKQCVHHRPNDRREMSRGKLYFPSKVRVLEAALCYEVPRLETPPKLAILDDFNLSPFKQS